MIPFNKPPLTGNEEKYVLDAMASEKIAGDGSYGKRCQEWFESKLGCEKALLTPSCTHALEMAAILIGIMPGDEVIMPSFTFVSTANAFVLRGAKIVFVDIRPDTMNLDESLLEEAITTKTKAIVPVHYAGIGCDMDAIMTIAQRYGLYVIEDAAQGMMSTYKNRQLGTIGHIGAYSFHETKNYTSGGEGGLLIINDVEFSERAEIIREKGTNRSQYFRGVVDKYSWVDIGSSYLMSEIQAAYLWGQLERVDDICQARKNRWVQYYDSLKPLEVSGQVRLPIIRDECEHNAHMFYLKVNSLLERDALIEYFRLNEIMAVFHYVPLHSSMAGAKYSIFHGEDKFTTNESERLIRLPLYYGIDSAECEQVIASVFRFMQ